MFDSASWLRCVGQKEKKKERMEATASKKNVTQKREQTSKLVIKSDELDDLATKSKKKTSEDALSKL